MIGGEWKWAEGDRQNAPSPPLAAISSHSIPGTSLTFYAGVMVDNYAPKGMSALVMHPVWRSKNPRL